MSGLALQVLKSLVKIENVSSFTDFVKAFSQFGNEMVELAHLSGDRQNVSAVPKYINCASMYSIYHLMIG